MHALHRTLSTGWQPAIDDTSIDPHLKAILAEAHSLTWFVVEGVQDVAIPAKGTGPGRPLADFIFAICYNSVLVRVKQGMRDKGLTTVLHGIPYGTADATQAQSISVELADSTYADDTAFFTLHRDALACITNASTLGSIVHKAMTDFGFEPNYDTGKTATSFHFKGKNAKRAKQRLAFDLSCMLPINVSDICINVVRSYQHVGTMNTSDMSNSNELTNRCSGHSRSLGALHKYVFKKTAALDQGVKQCLVDALANTKLLYSAETWPRLKPAQLQKIDYALLQSQARVLGLRLADENGVRLSRDYIATLNDTPDAGCALSLCRLRYLNKLILHAPMTLRVLLTHLNDEADLFPSLIRDDFVMLSKFTPTKGRNETLPYDANHWFGVIASSTSQYLSCIKRAHFAQISHKKDQAKLRLWTKTFNESLSAAGCPKYDPCALSVPMPNPQLEELAEEPTYLCYDCGYTCAKAKAWHKHRERIHGHVPPEALVVPDGQTSCNVCCKNFHTRVRLLWHLSHGNPACYDALLECNQSHTSRDEAILAATADRELAKQMRKLGQQKKLALLPVLEFYGPKWPAATTRSLRLADQKLPTIADGEVCNSPIDNSSVPSYTLLHNNIFDVHTLYILHLFSGQRREGDIQYWIEKLMSAPMYAHCNVIVLSVDIVNDPVMGDLTRKDTLKLWIRMLRDRRAIGVIAGPPCETWTVARYMPVEGMRDPPPPLRSLDQIWGFRNLSRKHRAQVDIGNELLRATLILVVEAYASGAFAIVEHPGEPTWVPEAPSIWRSSFVLHLRDHLGADLLDFDQCSAGADSRKPTCLMSVNLPQLRTSFRALPGRGFCIHGRQPHQATLRGLAADGTWRTAPAKQYPSDMCKAAGIATTGFGTEKVAQPSPGSLLELPHDTAPFFVPLDPYNSDQVLGAYGLDFANKGGGGKKPKSRGNGWHKPRPWLQPKPPEPDAATDEVHSAPNDAFFSRVSVLTDAQIDRIAANRANALRIRHERRLHWLQTFTDVTHAPSTPDQHIDPVVRPVQRLRTGATIRSRFAFGSVKPQDAIATVVSHMRQAKMCTVPEVYDSDGRPLLGPASPQLPCTDLGAGDSGFSEEVT